MEVEVVEDMEVQPAQLVLLIRAVVAEVTIMVMALQEWVEDQESLLFVIQYKKRE
jgi:hypothetical protein